MLVLCTALQSTIALYAERSFMIGCQKLTRGGYSIRRPL